MTTVPFTSAFTMFIVKFNVKFLLLLLLVLFLILSVFSLDFVTLDSIKSNKHGISYFISSHYFVSVLIFFVSCTVFINSPVPFAAMIKLMGGFFFGFYLGAFYNIAATILACLAGFGISRYAFKANFEARYYEKLKKIESEIENNGFYYFLSLRLMMVVPYFLINILAGISRLSFNEYLLSTCLGVVPASLIYANAGSKLEQVDSIQQIFRLDIVCSVVLVVLISLLPLIKKKLKLKVPS